MRGDGRPCVARGNVVLADHGGDDADGAGDVEREALGAAAADRVFRPRARRAGR